MTRENDPLTAASAALGTMLTAPEDLGGSERSCVLRCRLPDGGSVVIKTYQDSDGGRQSFAAEAAGLALAGGAGVAPRLLAASPRALLIVMTDLGSGPSVADLLLGDDASAAESALLAWTRSCGELAVAAVGRDADFAALLAAHEAAASSGRAAAGAAARAPGQADTHWLERRIGEIPALLAALSFPAPAGLDEDLAEVACVLRPGRYPVFSPGDICPDNNVLTREGVRFVDFESAEFHPAFLDAAYLRMPFSTCWCVFRLPPALRRRAEAVYRELVSQIHPDLADDRIWGPGVRRGVAAWTLHAMTYLLDRALIADMSMIDDGRAAPTKRQLLRYRWQLLISELEPGPRPSRGTVGSELPALRTLARQLLASTEDWRVPDLPAYPAFRTRVDLST
jgi:hypothetical protein